MFQDFFAVPASLGGTAVSGADVRQYSDPHPRLRRWRKRGRAGWALGRSRGGSGTKTHLKTDHDGLAIAFELAGGEATDKGRTHRLPCDMVLLHHGVVPNTQVARTIGVPHHWRAGQSAFVPEMDAWGRTPKKEVFIAGNGAGIGGAEAAAIAGALSALEIARDLAALTRAQRDEKARPLRPQLRRELAARPFIDKAYPPYGGALSPADDTIVCRCEEVTAGDIREMAKLGCLGPNQAKAFGRPGMGPCQGRYCGLTTTALLASETGQSYEETGYFRIRPPIKPVTLVELAGITEPQNRADDRQ